MRLSVTATDFPVGVYGISTCPVCHCHSLGVLRFSSALRVLYLACPLWPAPIALSGFTGSFFPCPDFLPLLEYACLWSLAFFPPRQAFAVFGMIPLLYAHCVDHSAKCHAGLSLFLSIPWRTAGHSHPRCPRFQSVCFLAGHSVLSARSTRRIHAFTLSEGVLLPLTFLF